MARITSDDCVQVVGDRFELILLASLRARDLISGAQLTVAKRNDKPAVLSLREIANHSVNIDDLRNKAKDYYAQVGTKIDESLTEEALTEAEEIIAKEIFEEIRKTNEENNITIYDENY